MYRNLPVLEDVNGMTSVHDLRNALRWCIRQIDHLENKIGEAKRNQEQVLRTMD